MIVSGQNGIIELNTHVQNIIPNNDPALSGKDIKHAHECLRCDGFVLPMILTPWSTHRPITQRTNPTSKLHLLCTRIRYKLLFSKRVFKSKTLPVFYHSKRRIQWTAGAPKVIILLSHSRLRTTPRNPAILITTTRAMAGALQGQRDSIRLRLPDLGSNKNPLPRSTSRGKITLNVSFWKRKRLQQSEVVVGCSVPDARDVSCLLVLIR